MNGLSILIPTYNDECVALVKDLLAQCQKELSINKDYEIIVADDGSNNNLIIDSNKAIATLPHCRIIFREQNSGRAAIRNFLADQAKFDTLLYIDSDMTVIRRDFIHKYINEASPSDIIYGGYDVPEQKGLDNNLRYIYERSCRGFHTAEKRREQPYMDFHTSNFMVPCAVMKSHKFDEHYRNYGYEDVAFGEELRKSGIRIKHIDNPMGFCRFEPNDAFVSKTEEGLRTLAANRKDLEGYSRLLAIIAKLEKLHLSGLCRILSKPLIKRLRKNLVGTNPSLKVFSFYKLFYLLNSIKSQQM